MREPGIAWKPAMHPRSIPSGAERFVSAQSEAAQSSDTAEGQEWIVPEEFAHDGYRLCMICFIGRDGDVSFWLPHCVLRQNALQKQCVIRQARQGLWLLS